MHVIEIVLYYLLPSASSSSTIPSIATILPSLLPANDMSEEYGLIYKILLGIAGIIITVTMYLSGKNIIFKFVCCSQYNDMMPVTTSSDSNVMELIELYEQ